MPLAEQRRIIRAYQQQSAAIGAATVATLERAWMSLGTYDDPAVERFAAFAVPVVAGAQTQAASLTDAYLALTLSDMTGRSVAPRGVAPDKVTALRRVAPGEVYRRPAVSMRMALAEGVSFEVALDRGRQRLVGITTADVQLARTHMARAVLSSTPGVRGFRRAVAGTCELCEVASRTELGADALMPTHPNCSCSPVPIVGEFDPGRLANDALLDEIPDEAISVYEHGELGPVLKVASHHATTLRQVGAARRAGGTTRGKPLDPDPLTNARKRQALIDEARKRASAAAQFDEAVFDTAKDAAGKRLLLNRVSLFRNRGDIPDDLADELVADINAGRFVTAQRKLRKYASGADTQAFAKVNDGALFDPKIHQAIGGSIRPGERVTIVRPGTRWKDPTTGRWVVLDRAVVEAGDPLPPLPKPPKGKPAKPTAESLTIAQIRKLAKDAGVRLPSKGTKAELIAIIRAWEQANVKRVLVGGPPLPKLSAAELAARAHVAAITKIDNGVARIEEAVREAMHQQAALVPKTVQQLGEIRAAVPTRSLGLADIRTAPGALAFYRFQFGVKGGREMVLSPYWHTRWPKMLAEDRKGIASGWFTPTGLRPGPGPTIAHEFGHHVDDTIMGGYARANGAWPADAANELFDAARRELGIRAPFVSGRLGTISRVELDRWVHDNKAVIAREVSKYGSKDFAEFLAEVWHEYSTRGDAARPHIKALGEVLRKWTERKARKTP